MAKEYEISKVSDLCRHCGREIAPGEELVATVVEADEQLERRDYCPACWEVVRAERDEADLFGLWRTRIPMPQEKKKLFVDDDLLVNFFERLDGSEDASRLSFRFVLALILMRKKVLVYDRSVKDEAGRDVWRMHLRGDERPHEVIDPQMDDEKIADVSRRLGEILEGEL